MTEYLVEGWTERIVETLTTDGAVQNLTGLTVSLLLYDNEDVLLGEYVSPKVGVVSAAAGTVFFDPGAGDLLAADTPHSVRWKVTDGAGKAAYWPSGQGDAPVIWHVNKP